MKEVGLWDRVPGTCHMGEATASRGPMDGLHHIPRCAIKLIDLLWLWVERTTRNERARPKEVYFQVMEGKAHRYVP